MEGSSEPAKYYQSRPGQAIEGHNNAKRGTG